jgi:hypothetical protein
LLADQFQAAATSARSLADLDHISQMLWKAHGQGAIPDAAATAASEAVEARRARIKAGRPQPLPSPPSARRRPPRSPDRARSIERRRRQAASGAMPPQLAARFTLGEQSALSVVAREVARAGRCTLFVDAIAAMAGTCRSVVQSAVREAARLGLLRVTERRVPGRRSLSNIIEVLDKGWLAWMAYRVRKTKAHDQDYKITSENALRSTEDKRIGAPMAHTRAPNGADRTALRAEKRLCEGRSGKKSAVFLP